MPVSWKSVWNDFVMAYSAREAKVEPQPSKTENQLTTKFIVILVLTAFFALCIVFLCAAIFYKWLQKRRHSKGKDELTTATKKRTEHAPQDKPHHVKLMRTDSSASEIAEISRDSSLPSTPLSPLSEEDNLTSPFERGRLEFSMFYDREQELLKTTIIQAHGLPQRSCIFYVEATLLPDITTRQKTGLRQHNPSPVFEESLKFALPFEELPVRTLCLDVVELDAFSQKLSVGHLLYSFDIENNNYMDMTRLDVELNRGRPADNCDDINIGEILMSLCYLPTAARLTVVVLKCRLFQANHGMPSPFLKVSLVLNRKQVKKVKTSVKSKTLDPVYNEAFIFDVPPQHIGNVGLYARVVNERDSQELLGKVIIGPNAKTSMGVHHWEHMMLSPRKPIAQWHKIL